MTVSSATASPRSGTRDRILDAALALFAEKGYEATSMREIAEQLGITKPALYYHFDSKEDIVRALLADIETQVDALVAWTKAQPPGPDLRRQVLERWTDIMQAHGITAFKFVVANRQVVHEISPDRSGMVACMHELYRLLAGPEASVEEQLRVRIALMSVNMAGIVGAGIDAPEEEILATARRLALELMPAAE
ncbi:MAG: TetR/AcrR family transcriptional regulator [Nocardioidaceae bacterium]|nr:TetR/AcrR family transcriptional regulator [Nocardioidaceae bacterium]